MTLRRLILGLAPLCLAGSALAAPPPAELFFKDPDIVEAVLSPSGRKLAITSAKGIGRVGLAVVDLAPGGRIARIAQLSETDISGVHWVNEDRLVFNGIDVSEGSGRHSSWPGLFAVNSDGTRFRKIAGGGAVLHGVPVPAPGETNEELLVERPTGEQVLLYRLNARTGAFHELHLDAPANTVGWITDSRAEPRVALTRDKDRQAAYWRAPGSTTWTRLYESGLMSKPYEIEGVDDAGSLYVTRPTGAGGHAWLTRYDFQAGKPEDRFIVETPGFDFDGRVLTEAGSGKAQGVRVTVEGETTVWFDPQLKALQAEADRLFPGRVNRISCRRCGQADMVAVVRSYSDRDPGRLYLYQAKPPEGEKAWRAIGPVMDGVKPEQMARMDLHRTQARDGRDLPVWVTRPAGTPGPLPAVVLVHGGPWARGSEWGWHALPQFLASRGYVVIEPEFRGSTGYGAAHFMAGFKQWGRAMQDDVADALLWAQKQGLASDKACITGDSYGGYSALMGLIKDPGLYRCGIAGFALTDLDLYVRGSWWVSDNISSASRRYTMPELVADPDKDAELIAAHSPVKLAGRIKAPVMLVFGEDDQRVPLAHGERMRKALREAGNEPVWVSYAGEAHGLGSVKNRVDYAQRVEAFLAKHLGSAQR